jgi:hypothetical protein
VKIFLKVFFIFLIPHFDFRCVVVVVVVVVAAAAAVIRLRLAGFIEQIGSDL